MKNSESKKQDSNRPLVIYVSENDHGDMSYGSVMEQIIKDCHAKGLSTQTFSEFPSQTRKVETQKLTNQSSDVEVFQETTKFLDEQFIEMGSIDGRYPIFQKSWDSYPDTLTPSQLFENQKSQIDNPELLQILEEEIEARKKDGTNKAGKEEGGDLYNFYRLRSCLHYEQIHQIMAADVKTKLKDDVDVVIMVAGSPHIPGLDSQLDRLKDCPKFVVGNVLSNPKDLEERLLFGGTPTACAQVGQLVGFDVDSVTKEATIPEAVQLAIDARSQAKSKTYDKGLNPTTTEFTSYINGSNDWANIGKEIQYFIGLLDSENEFERVDAKGYALTCMFKILGAIDEFDSKKTGKDGKLIRPDDPRKDIDPSVQDFLGGDLSKEAVRLKTLKYSQEIIEEYGEEKTAPALSSAASAYGVRAYMQYLGLLTEGEASPNQEPQKYYQGITDPKLSENTKKNIALAMEKFEESAALGNVRSMGSVVYWAGLSNHPKLQELNEKWTKEAATASTPSPNSQIDYAKMLESKGDQKGAETMLKKAVDFGLDKALKEFHKKQQDAELKGEEKQPQVQVGNLNAVEAARNFKDDPEIIGRYTVFNPQNVYRSASEVLELHDATGVDIMPRGNAVNPGDIIGVGLICFRPERIAKQLTVASVNMQAKIDEESFPRIVDDVFGNYVAKEMASVVPQVNQMRLEIQRNVAEAGEALQENPEINTEGNAVLTKVKEARDKIRQKAEGKIPPVSEEFINAMAAKYATDLLYNESPEIFKLVEDAVARGMEQAAKEEKYEPLSGHQNNERVAIVVAGGPASGKTQATEMALHSLVDSRDVMAFSTDQLRTLVSPGETGGPAFTDLEANLVFRQIIGKMDRAMKSDVAPTILSEGTSLNPGAINHLLTGGAQVHASLISIPAEVALERAGKRAASDKAADQGRSYSDEYLLGLHKQDGTALPNITNQLQGKNVQLSIFDNNVPRGQSPELIGRMNLQTMEMEIYNVQKLAELEQKGKIDPTQSKDQGMYAADDKLPENNISFLTDALKKFSVTFRDGEMGEEYAASKPGEKLTITNQALFDSKQQNPYDKALTSPLLEEAKKAEQEQKSGDSWVKKLGLEDKAEKPRSFLEAAQAGKYGNIGSKGGAHEL